MPESRLARSETDRMIAGVCGGMAAYLDVDPVFVRLAFVALFFASGIGLPIYVVLALITPRESEPADRDAPKFESIEAPARAQNSTFFFSALLTLLGAYLLLQNLGFHLTWLMPVLLIGAGAWLLIRRS